MKKFVDFESPANQEINRRIEKVAKDVGASMAQVAYAWALAQDYITAPIIGSTKIEHLVEAIGGWICFLHLSSDAEPIARIRKSEAVKGAISVHQRALQASGYQRAYVDPTIGMYPAGNDGMLASFAPNLPRNCEYLDRSDGQSVVQAHCSP